MDKERYYHNGKPIPPKKYKTCPNPRCKKPIYNHTIQEAKVCEQTAMADA